MTGELPYWLSQQIDAAETRTRELLVEAQRTSLTLRDPKLLGRYIPGWHGWPEVERTCQARLAEIAAMRAILAEHSPNTAGTRTVCSVCAEEPYYDATWYDYPCPTVRLLAAAFSAEPGYRTEWGPQ
ncbi:DUF6221 family protein [Micromonospora sp. NPDC000207]|uniref:DUF6221 family protein n=1 Tax=Micromonospora sp. NPDC000207 TaxID=3154246 RepID=UPI00333036D9